MKIHHFLLPSFVMVSPIHADEPAEVRELATTYMNFRNQKKYDDLTVKCLYRGRVTDRMLQATRMILELGIKIESFKIEKATNLDKQLFREGVVLGEQGLLYYNLDPAWVIVFSCAPAGATPASTERVAVGQIGDKWRVSMLAPKNN